MHNANDVIDPCSNSDSDSDSDMPLTQADGIEVNPTMHQTYNAMVVDLVATFDNTDTENDSDTPVSNTNKIITNASLDATHGPSFADLLAMFDNRSTNDTDSASSKEVLEDAHTPTEIKTTDHQYRHKTHMMHNLTISSSPHNGCSHTGSYSDTLATWRRHVEIPFPLIIQCDTIALAQRSSEVRLTHTLGYDIKMIQGEGNCFFHGICKEYSRPSSTTRPCN